MTMNASLLVTANAEQAKAELRALGTETVKAGAATEAMGGQATGTAGDFAALIAKINTLEAALALLKAKEDEGAGAGERFKKSHQGAAGSVGNLAAQFNDIGIMMAAGQNPLQLAIQQGSQITQVIGPMGAAGAVKALGQAFVGMLSPVNLATYAIIAGGAALVQWFMSGEDASKSLEDAVGDLEGSVKGLKESAGRDLAALKKDFGAVTPEVVALNAEIGKLADLEAILAVKDAIAALKAETAGDWLSSGQVAIGDLLNVDMPGMPRWSRGDVVPPQIAAFQRAVGDLAAAKGIDDQLTALREMNEQFVAATGGIASMTAEQVDYYRQITETEAALRRMAVAQTEAVRVAQELARSQGTENTRMGGPTRFDVPAGPSDDERSAALAEAHAMAEELQRQVDLNQLVAQYGEDSANVTLARLEAEREATAEAVRAMDVSAELKANLMLSWDAANGLGRARIAAAIEAALGPASRLSSILQAAAGWFGRISAGMSLDQFQAGGLAAQYETYGQGRVAGENLVRENGSLFGGDGNVLNNSPVRASAGKGGGAAQEEASAVATLIAKLREEQEVLLTVDPVKKEMLQYRKQLADATEAERAEVETLIRTELQLNNAREAGRVFNDMAGSFLDDVIAKGAKAGDVIRRLASDFLAMAAKGFLTGEGPIATLLGLSGGLFSATAKAKADGGLITGPGGPRDDKVPIWGSAGEFMVNARATARYRPMLELINAGADIPGFAKGGAIDGRTSGQAATRGSGRVMEAHFHINGNGSEELQTLVTHAVTQAMELHDREVLPMRVMEIQRSPRFRGR